MILSRQRVRTALFIPAVCVFVFSLIACPGVLPDFTGDQQPDDESDPSDTSTPSLIYVSPAGNDANDGTTAGSPVSTIGRAMEIVSPDGEIRIAGGTYGESLTIQNSVTLRGSYSSVFDSVDLVAHPTTIDAAGLENRVLSARSVDLELHNLILQNGRANVGGGINFDDGDLLIDSCRIIANESTEWGGGGVNLGSAAATIRDSWILNNSATRDVDSNGGGLNAGESTLIFENVVFSGNACNGNAGGGMFLSGSTATFTECRFESNSISAGYGGGINGWESNLAIDSCEFIANEALHGGAVNVGPTGYVAEITSCSFSGNTPDDVCGEYVSGDISYDAIVPNHGDVFDLVTLSGSGFGTGTEGDLVLMFAGTTSGGVGVQDLLIRSWSESEIVFHVPDTGITGEYYVQLVDPASGPHHAEGYYPVFTVDNLYTQTPISGVTITPEALGPGAQASIEGAGFTPVSGTLFAEAHECEVATWSETEIVFIVPASIPVRMRSYMLTISTPYGTQSLGAGFQLIPDAPTVDSNAHTAVTLIAETLPDASSYRLLRADSVEGPYIEVASSPTVTMTDASAQAATTYYYCYRGESGGSIGAMSPAVSVTTTEAETPDIPEAPDAPTVTATSTTSVSLSWSTVAGATSYTLYRSASASTGYTAVTTTAATAYTDSGLTPDSTWYYRVSASNDSGEGEMGSYVEATTPAEAIPVPEAPDTPTVTATSTTSVSLSWSTVAGATSYTLYRSASASTGYTAVTTTAATAYTDSGLTPDSTWYYRVSASNDSGESEMGSYVEATTPAEAIPVPEAPDTPTVTATSTTSVSLSWSTVTGATSYTLYRSASASTGYTAVTTTAATAYTDSGLTPDSTWYYRVSASNDSGESEMGSYRQTATEGLPPSAPIGLSVVTSTESSVTLSWNGVTGATSYTVYRSTSQTSGYASVGSTGSPGYTDDGLSAGSSYYYRVSATNQWGEGAQSNYAAAQTELGYEVISTGAIQTGTYQLATAGGTVSHTFNADSGTCSYSAAGYTYSGTYTHNAATGALTMNVSRSEVIYGYTSTTNMAMTYSCAFTTDGGAVLHLGPFEITSGAYGELPGSYAFSLNQTITVSVMGTTNTSVANSSATLTYDAGGSYSSVVQVSGASPTTTTTSGTWVDNGDGTITQYQSSPTTGTTVFTPRWATAYGKEFLIASNSGYTRQ